MVGASRASPIRVREIGAEVNINYAFSLMGVGVDTGVSVAVGIVLHFHWNRIVLFTLSRSVVGRGPKV